MVDPMDDIARQARQGSVSAIIQVLNEKLADSGVRTRAVFANGILQLLCEAPQPEQLEQPVLVPHVKRILESLQPRSIRRVNINSRIVREQQLLWLEEINRDPEGQLLWSEEISLAHPSPFKRWLQDRKHTQLDANKTNLPKASPVRLKREKRVFWRGLVGGASLSLFLLLVGWAVHNWLYPKFQGQFASGQNAIQDAEKNSEQNSGNGNASSGATSGNSAEALADRPSALASHATQATQAEDPFVLAVRLAEQTVEKGRSAKASADWLALAAQWQRASDLMSQVPASDARYTVAQDRVKVYQQHSQTATQQAERSR